MKRAGQPGFRRQQALRRRRRNGAAANERRIAFLSIENKFFDVEHTGSSVAVTWGTEEPATTNLTAIAQGDGESNRDGRKYIINSIHIKGFVHTAVAESSAAPLEDVLVRLVLVHDKQTNGAQLTATDVMDGGQTDDINSFRNLQFTKRFNVLWDKTFLIVRNNTNEGAINLFAANATKSNVFKVNKVFKGGIAVTMSGTTADIANVVDNSIHMIGVSTSTTGTVSYQCRVRFSG